MKSIILIDDDAGILDVFKQVFERAGYAITIFNKGELVFENKFDEPDIFIIDKQLSGANYDMQPPNAKVAKPAGEFNHTRIVVNKGHVEHWLNGTKVVEYELWSPEWQKQKENSKWKNVKPYGMSKKGHIALQDHGGGVAFKNIKIKPL